MNPRERKEKRRKRGIEKKKQRVKHPFPLSIFSRHIRYFEIDCIGANSQAENTITRWREEGVGCVDTFVGTRR